MSRKKYTHIPVRILTIAKNDGYHLALKAKINGKVAHLILDTGASRSVFDLSVSQKFFPSENNILHTPSEKLSTGLGTNTMKSSFIHFHKLEIGELLLKDYQCVLLDLSHVNQSYQQAGLKSIDGVLGNDILLPHKALINYQQKELRLNLLK